MATLAEMQDALRNADAAGDTEAAKQLADAIYSRQASPAPAPAPAPAAPVAAPKPRASLLKRALDYNIPAGIPEAVTNMATGMGAKFAGDAAGLVGLVGDVTGAWKNDPTATQNTVRNALTYEPRTEAGKDIAEYNPITLIGKGVGYVADQIGDAVQYDEASDTLQGATGNLLREGIPAAVGFLGMKGGQATRPNYRAGRVFREITGVADDTARARAMADTLRTANPSRTTAQILAPENRAMIGGAENLVINSNHGQPVLNKIEAQRSATQNALNRMAGGSDEAATAAARKAAKEAAEAELAPVRQQQLQLAGQSGNLQIKSILKDIEARLKDPMTLINDTERIALSKLHRKLSEAELAPGVVDPAVLAEVRRLGVKPLMGDLVKSGKADASIAARTVGRVQAQIDDAMEAAGASGWRSDYMKPYAAKLQAVDRLAVLDMLRKQHSKNPRKFAETVGNENTTLVKKLMNGERDINKVLPNEIAMLRQMADDVKVRSTVEHQASSGAAGAADVLSNASSRFRIPNMLSPKIAITNRLLGEKEIHLNKQVFKRLSKAMADPKYAADLLRNHNYGGTSPADVAAAMYLQSLQSQEGEQ